MFVRPGKAFLYWLNVAEFNALIVLTASADESSGECRWRLVCCVSWMESVEIFERSETALTGLAIQTDEINVSECNRSCDQRRKNLAKKL